MILDQLPRMWSGQTSVEALKKIADVNINSLDDTLNCMLPTQTMAKFISQMFYLNSEINTINSTSAHKMFQAQIKHMKLQAASDAIKGWADIFCNTSTSIGQSNSNFIEKFLNGIAEYAELAQKANTPDDITPICSHTLKGLKENTESYAMEILGTINSANSALEIWTKSNLDAYASEPVSSSS